MKLFQKYKAKKAAKIQERKAQLEQEKMAVKMKVDALELNMIRRPCAVRGMDLCSSECVHWREGHVSYFIDWPEGGDGFYYTVSPSCRLWGDK